MKDGILEKSWDVAYHHLKCVNYLYEVRMLLSLKEGHAEVDLWFPPTLRVQSFQRPVT